MKNARLHIVIIFFVTVSIVTVYTILTQRKANPTLAQAKIAYETERLNVKRANLQRNSDLTFYSAIGLLSVCGLALLIVALGHSRAKIRQASVFIAKIGEHSAIPVHHQDLQHFYPIAVNLSLAEIQASVSNSHERAYQLSRQMIEDITTYTRALAGQRGLLSSESRHGELPSKGMPLSATPTFADLLRHETVTPGKPLLVGYDSQGQPQYRDLQDLKSLAVAGWQGSGKTLSMAYLVASSVLACNAEVFVIDPHKNHDQGLYALLKPLERHGNVKVINPFDTPALLRTLNTTLDRRLAGEESCDRAIVLVIDELARLAKMEVFDELVKFLERCTEETRKANITFIGGSHKWTARHFKGRADIRGCMNSMLIHKTKPSQADLLLEDGRDKHLVKQLQRPGDAILVTDYDQAELLTIPFVTRGDMETVAARLVRTSSNQSNTPPPSSPASSSSLTKEDAQTAQQDVPRVQAAAHTATAPDESHVVIQLEQHRQKHTAHAPLRPEQLTVEMIREQLERRRSLEPELTQSAIARQIGISASFLSRILNYQRPLNAKYKHRLYDILFVHESERILAMAG